MNAEDIREFCINKMGVEEDFPFDQETLVFKVGGKMFLLMSLEMQPLCISVKTDPQWSEELRATYSQIYGAYHMNKTHWNTLVLEGLPKELIAQLINHSYDLIYKKLTKKMQEKLSRFDMN